MLALAVIRLTDDDELSALSTRAEPVLTTATPRTITDERQVRLELTREEGAPVVAPGWNGLVTAAYAQPGKPIADGDRVAAVAGIDRIAFASATPFYRPISPGTQGADVTELHRLLVATGHMAAMPATPTLSTFATGSAVSALATVLGGPEITTFDPGWVVWLPVAPFIPGTIDLRLGSPAPGPGQPIMKPAGTVTKATVEASGSEPLALEAGVAYLAVTAAGEVAIDAATLQVVAADLPKLATLPGAASPAPGQPGPGLQATLKRATPLTTLAVPTASVMVNDAGTLCLWLQDGNAYRAIPVKVGGSRGGATNVVSGLQPGQSFLANPSQVLKDPACP